MDTSEYMPMFLAEATEHLQELNLAVVQLEENPSDRATLDQIFRIAHSLKGMSATMGFAQIAKLTHEMEEVFELLRQRTSGLGQDAVDAVLACLDALSERDRIDRDRRQREARPDAPDRAAARLVRAGHAGEAARSRRGSRRSRRDGRRRAAQEAGARVLHIVAVLDDEVMMPAVRAHMLFAALAEHGELVANDTRRRRTSRPSMARSGGVARLRARGGRHRQGGDARIGCRVG